MPSPDPARPWRGWYNLAAWKRRRAFQLASEPLCVECLAQGRETAANTADHVIPHKGDWELFIAGQLQSLCETCHSAIKQRAEKLAAREDRLGSAESSRPVIR